MRDARQRQLVLLLLLPHLQDLLVEPRLSREMLQLATVGILVVRKMSFHRPQLMMLERRSGPFSFPALMRRPRRVRTRPRVVDETRHDGGRREVVDFALFASSALFHHRLVVVVVTEFAV